MLDRVQREREKQRKRNRKEARAMLLLLKARNHGWRANTFRSVRFRSDERFVSNSSIASWKRCTWWLENDWNEIFGRHVNNMHTGTGCKGPGHDRLTNRFLRGRVALPSVRSSPPSTPFSFARTPRKRKKSDIEHDLVFSLLIACSKERKKRSFLVASDDPLSSDFLDALIRKSCVRVCARYIFSAYGISRPTYSSQGRMSRIRGVIPLSFPTTKTLLLFFSSSSSFSICHLRRIDVSAHNHVATSRYLIFNGLSPISSFPFFSWNFFI